MYSLLDEKYPMLQVDPGQGRWSWPCCPGPTKPYVVRERAGYGDLEPATLDPLLDTVDQILSVSRDFQWVISTFCHPGLKWFH